MTDIVKLQADFAATKSEAERLKAIMWRTKAQADISAFEKAFFAQGAARRALEAATGKSTLNAHAPDRHILQRDAHLDRVVESE